MKCLRCGKEVTASACECGFIPDDFAAVTLFPLTESEKTLVNQAYGKSEFIIKDGTFYGYCGDKKISELHIPDGVTHVASFEGLEENVLTLYIPASVKKIKNYLLHDYEIENIVVDKDNKVYYSEEGVLFKYGSSYNVEGFHISDTVIHDDTGNTLVCYPNNRKTSIYKVPDNIVAIASSAFEFAELERIKFPMSLKRIGSEVFSHCENLTGIDIPDNVRSIGDDFVLDCPKLRSLSMPYISNERTPIPRNCYDIAEFTLRVSDLLTEINTGEFDHLWTKEQVDNSNNITVVLPDTVTKISDEAFAGIKNLRSIRFSQNLISIGESAFTACINLSEISFPGKLELIKKGAFWGCISLKEVTLPSSIVSVEEIAFGPNVEFVNYLGEGTGTNISENAFVACNLSDDHVLAPDAIKDKIIAGSHISNKKECGIVDFYKTSIWEHFNMGTM